MKHAQPPVQLAVLAIALVGLSIAVADPSVTGLFHKEGHDFEDLVCNKRGLCPTAFAGTGSPFGCVDTPPVKVADRCTPDPTPDPGATACFDYPTGTSTGHVCSSSTSTYVCDSTGLYETKKSSCSGNVQCVDTDGGVAVTVKGIVTAPSRSLPFIGSFVASPSTEYKDHCVGAGGIPAETSSILREYFCTDEGVGFVDYDCSSAGGMCKDPPGGPDACTAVQGGNVPPAPCAGVDNPCSTSADCPVGKTCLGCSCVTAPPPSPFNAIWGYPIVNQDCRNGDVMTIYGQSRVCTQGQWEVLNPVPQANSFFDVFTTVQAPNEAQTLAEATITRAVAQPATEQRCGPTTQCANLVPGTTSEAVQRCRSLYPQSPVPLGCNSNCQCAPTQG